MTFTSGKELLDEFIFSVFITLPAVCNRNIGLRDIPAEHLSSSASINSILTNGRINGVTWKTNTWDAWIQVDFNKTMIVTAIKVQKGNANYVSTFKIRTRNPPGELCDNSMVRLYTKVTISAVQSEKKPEQKNSISQYKT